MRSASSSRSRSGTPENKPNIDMPYRIQSNFSFNYDPTIFAAPEKTRVLMDSIALARRLFSCARSRAYVVHSLSEPEPSHWDEHTPISDVKMSDCRKDADVTRLFDKYTNGDAVVFEISMVHDCWAYVEPSTPWIIYIADHGLSLAVAALLTRDTAIYNRHILLLAWSIGHEYARSIRYFLGSVEEKTTPTTFRDEIHYGEEVYKSQTINGKEEKKCVGRAVEGGWWWERMVMGGPVGYLPYNPKEHPGRLVGLFSKLVILDWRTIKERYFDLTDEIVEKLCGASDPEQFLPLDSLDEFIPTGYGRVCKRNLNAANTNVVSRNGVDLIRKSKIVLKK